MTSKKKLTKLDLFSYGILGLPLGFIGLPLYVYLPKFYAENYGVSLVSLSILLLITRVIDTVQDPFIGWFSDHLNRFYKKSMRRKIIFTSIPFLCLSFFFLLFPADFISPFIWIGFFLVLTYTVYSFLSINYYTISPEITPLYHEQTKLVSSREGLALIGISLGSVVPAALISTFSVSTAHLIIWLFFSVIMISAAFIFYQKSPKPTVQRHANENFFGTFSTILKNKGFLKLAFVFLLSTIAASIPATVVLFYIKDVLDGEVYFGLFLALYFLCALFGMPLWYKFSIIYNKKTSWMISMTGSVIGFIWATFLGPGDYISYGLVCIITGLCLGGDLSMPASLLSDILQTSSNKGKYFGVWGMLGKSSIAIAGSLGLFVLGVMGYVPGEAVTNDLRFSISVSYALIPCFIKLTSLVVLYITPIDTFHSKES